MRILFPRKSQRRFMKTSIQSRIKEWHYKTFGATTSELGQAMIHKLSEEYVEVMKAFNNAEPKEKIGEELADILIVCYGLASRMDIDLDQMVEEKFEIVKMRTDQISRDIQRGIPC